MNFCLAVVYAFMPVPAKLPAVKTLHPPAKVAPAKPKPKRATSATPVRQPVVTSVPARVVRIMPTTDYPVAPQYGRIMSYMPRQSFYGGTSFWGGGACVGGG